MYMIEIVLDRRTIELLKIDNFKKQNYFYKYLGNSMFLIITGLENEPCI